MINGCIFPKYMLLKSTCPRCVWMPITHSSSHAFLLNHKKQFYQIPFTSYYESLIKTIRQQREMIPTDTCSPRWSTGRSYHDPSFNLLYTSGKLHCRFCHFMTEELLNHYLAFKPSLLGSPEQKLGGPCGTYQAFLCSSEWRWPHLHWPTWTFPAPLCLRDQSRNTLLGWIQLQKSKKLVRICEE